MLVVVVMPVCMDMVFVMLMLVIMSATSPMTVIMLVGMRMFMRMSMIVAMIVGMGVIMHVAVIMQTGMGMIVMVMGMIMPAPAIGAVVVSGMRTMIMRTVIMVRMIMAFMGIGTGFGLERPCHMMGVTALPAHHFRQHMIILNIDRIGGEFGRRMAIADMPGHFQQTQRVFGFDFQQ